MRSEAGDSRGLGALPSYLELFRAFLAPSAIADSFSGLALACLQSGGDLRIPVALGAAAASAFLYSAGAAFNDLFDLEKDRVFAPSRPLPAGKISPRSAAIGAALAGTLGLALASAIGAALPGAGILAFAILYDAGLKRWPFLGALFLGFCRGGNFLLGASAGLGIREATASAPVLWAAGALTLFVAGITGASRAEDTGRKAHLIRASALVLAVPLAFAAAQRADAISWLQAALLEIALAYALIAALRSQDARRAASKFVGMALGTIYFLHAEILFFLGQGDARRWSFVAVLYGLWAAARALRGARAARGLSES